MQGVGAEIIRQDPHSSSVCKLSFCRVVSYAGPVATPCSSAEEQRFYTPWVRGSNPRGATMRLARRLLTVGAVSESQKGERGPVRSLDRASPGLTDVETPPEARDSVPPAGRNSPSVTMPSGGRLLEDGDAWASTRLLSGCWARSQRFDSSFFRDDQTIATAQRVRVPFRSAGG